MLWLLMPAVADGIVADAIVGDALVGDAMVGDAMVGDAMVGDATVADGSQGTVESELAAPGLLNGPCCSSRIKVAPI